MARVERPVRIEGRYGVWWWQCQLCAAYEQATGVREDGRHVWAMFPRGVAAWLPDANREALEHLQVCPRVAEASSRLVAMLHDPDDIEEET